MDAVNFFLNSSCLNLLRYGICYLSETLQFIHQVAFQTDMVLFCGLICIELKIWIQTFFQVVQNRISSFSECMVLKLDIASLDFEIIIPSLQSFTYTDRWNYGTITLHVDMGFLIWCQIFACLMLWWDLAQIK